MRPSYCILQCLLLLLLSSVSNCVYPARCLLCTFPSLSCCGLLELIPQFAQSVLLSSSRLAPCQSNFSEFQAFSSSVCRVSSRCCVLPAYPCFLPRSCFALLTQTNHHSGCHAGEQPRKLLPSIPALRSCCTDGGPKSCNESYAASPAWLLNKAECKSLGKQPPAPIQGCAPESFSEGLSHSAEYSACGFHSHKAGTRRPHVAVAGSAPGAAASPPEQMIAAVKIACRPGTAFRSLQHDHVLL